MKLPTERVPTPPPTLDGQNLLFMGAPKMGKSLLVNRWPNCLVIDTQGGHRTFGGMVVDLAEEAKEYGSRMAALRAVVKTLREDCPYGAVALDTLDDVSQWLEEAACANLRIRHNKSDREYATVGDIPHGAGWVEHRGLVLRLVRAFIDLPCTTIFVAHSRSLVDEEPGEMTKMLDLPGRLGHMIPGEVGHIGIAYRTKDGEYMLSFEGYETMSRTQKDRKGNVTKQGKVIVQAGSRFDQLQGKHFPASYEAISEALGSTGER